MSDKHIRLDSLRLRLRRTQDSIREVENSGQSFSLDDGMTYTRATLQRLLERERKLYRQIARTEGKAPMFKKIRMG